MFINKKDGRLKMNDFKISNLLNGRPDNMNDKKEIECYDILDKLNIHYQRVEYNFFPSEIEDLKLIDNTLQVAGIKNLMFKTKNKNQFFFIILPREDRFDEKTFRVKNNLSKLTMAKEEDLKELLKTHSGAVSIMELVNDRENMIKLFIDKRILENKYFRFHPNENKSTVRISMNDFKDILIPYLGHKINIL